MPPRHRTRNPFQTEDEYSSPGGAIPSRGVALSAADKHRYATPRTRPCGLKQLPPSLTRGYWLLVIIRHVLMTRNTQHPPTNN
ncbi:MAG: hypothetical protein ACK5V5_15320 [Cyclobacteriaceae bacterium]|nr:hypothetical protein [Flammeovirgaceae bacterium]